MDEQGKDKEIFREAACQCESEGTAGGKMGCGTSSEGAAGREETGKLLQPICCACQRNGSSLRASVAGSLGNIAYMGIYRADKKRVFRGRDVRSAVYPPGRLCRRRQNASESGKKAGLGQCGGSRSVLGENIAS